MLSIPTMLHRITLWKALKNRFDHTSIRETWGEFTTRLTNHVRAADKMTQSGFGPYAVCPPPAMCYRHPKFAPTDRIHRCDWCVEALSLAVFDADRGTQAEVDACDELLERDGIARHWYTSHSHGSKAPLASYRLVIPLAQEISPTIAKPLRLAAIQKYRIPADPSQCSGVSHFYFLPTCPPGATNAVSISRPGKPLGVLATGPLVPPRRRPRLDDWEPPEEPAGPIDLAPLRDKLEVKRRRLVLRDPRKAELLGRCLAGEELAGHGAREVSTRDLTGMVAWELPGTPLSVLMHLVRPSVDRMIAAGSTRVTYEKVEALLLGAMRYRAEHDAEQARMQEWCGTRAAKAQAAIPKYDGK